MYLSTQQLTDAATAAAEGIPKSKIIEKHVNQLCQSRDVDVSQYSRAELYAIVEHELTHKKEAPSVDSDAEVDATGAVIEAFSAVFVRLIDCPEYPIISESAYNDLVLLLNGYIDIIGEDENHIAAPFMEFVGNLIEQYEDVHVPEL